MALTTDFEAFFAAYLDTALWSSIIGEGSEENPGSRDGKPFDKYFTRKDFSKEALLVLRAHAMSFWSRMWYYIDHETNPRTPGNAGHDFWLTQNGHGVGFWDGDWPVYGEMLTRLAKCYPEINLAMHIRNKSKRPQVVLG